MFVEEFRDIFGFDEEIRAMREKERATKAVLDEKPIMPFNSNAMLESLARQKVGVYNRGFQDFSNVVQWGTNPGAIRVRLGSQYTVYIERLIFDFDSNPVWTTKKVFRINTEEYKQYHESVGDAIYDELSKIALQNLDSAKREYNDTHELAQEIKDTIDGYAHDMFVFERIKKVNENNSLLVYAVKGGGVGALQTPGQAARINQIIVDVNFSEDTGLIRIMNTAVVTGDEGYSWHLMPSFFEGMFAPTQDFKEIAEAVTTAMKWF